MKKVFLVLIDATVVKPENRLLLVVLVNFNGKAFLADVSMVILEYLATIFQNTLLDPSSLSIAFQAEYVLLFLALSTNAI